MNQVQYGYELSDVLSSDPTLPELKESLQAQLSHSDGIRGFMVSYLTAGEDDSENLVVPDVLTQVLQEQAASTDDLIPLACMNVVMPTAMVTMHQNAQQSNNSAKTAKRGIQVWKTLQDIPSAKENAQAILQEEKSFKLYHYWFIVDIVEARVMIQQQVRATH